jgi:TPR repeat protein
MRARESGIAIGPHERDRNAEHLFRQAELYEEAGDLPSAFACVLQAAKQGHTGSQVNVGNKYASGEGVSKNLRQAEYWYKQAYRNGRSIGALNLAIDRKNEGRPRSAFFWLRKAAEMGDGNAMLELAQMCLARGRKADARTLLKKAQDLGPEGISEDDLETVSLLLKGLDNKRERA